MTIAETERRRRRQRGLGSLHRRTADDSWVATINIPTGKGTRDRKSVSSKTFCGVLMKLRELRKVYPQRQVTPRMTRGRGDAIFAARLLGMHTYREWVAKVIACDHRCFYCGRKCSSWILEKDHVVPVSRGGSDGIDNVVVACYPCNRGKSDMTVEEWRHFGSPRVLIRNGRRLSAA